MGAPLMYGDNCDLWVSNDAKDYFCDLVAEIAKLHGNDISLAFEEEPGIAGTYGVSGLGIELEGFFDYFGGKDFFIDHLRVCKIEIYPLCDSIEVAKNMQHIFSWVIYILNGGHIREETHMYKVMPPPEYRQIICEFLSSFVDEYDRNGQLIFDVVRDRYLVMHNEWQDEERLYGCAIQLDIIDSQIWIQHNSTEIYIDRELIQRGVAPKDIIMGFRSPSIRKLLAASN